MALYNKASSIYGIGSTFTAALDLDSAKAPGAPRTVNLNVITPGAPVSGGTPSLTFSSGGLYAMSGTLAMSGASITSGQDIGVSLAKNGLALLPSPGPNRPYVKPETSSPAVTPFALVERFSAGDTLTMYVAHTGGTNLTLYGLNGDPDPDLDTHITFIRVSA